MYLQFLFYPKPKYLGVKLIKYVHDLYNEDYKVLFIEIK